MKRRGREPDLYNGVFAMVLVVAIVLAFLRKDANVFFSGALVAFTGLLWRVNVGLRVLQGQLVETQNGTLDLQKRFDEREESRANPEPIFHDTSRLESVSGFDIKKNVGKLHLTFSVSNPGDSVMLIESVQINDETIGSPVASQLAWVSRHPVLATSPRGGPYNHGFPAPVFPGGLTELKATFEFHNRKMCSDGEKLRSFDYSITYRLGNSDATKSADWTRHG